MIAAPALAILVASYMTFASFHTPTGLGIELLPTDCKPEVTEKLMLLHITNDGRVLLNAQPQEWNTVQNRLWGIYNTRVSRTLYLLGDDEVPFQTMANAMDIADNLSIKLTLVTPQALITRVVSDERCSTPADMLLGSWR